MIPQNFAEWTREQRSEFDLIKSKCFEPTEEEKKEQQEALEKARKELILQKTSAIGVTIQRPVTKERAIYFLKQINAREFVGDDLSSRVDNQEKLFGSLDIAFDDLVIRYL